MCIPWYGLINHITEQWLYIVRCKCTLGLSSLVQFWMNKIFQISTHRRSGKQTFCDTLGYTHHWTVIVVILVSLACKRCRLARHLPKQFQINNFILIFFRLYFGSVETLKYKPTKSVPRSCHVFLGASVFCVSLPGIHISWGYTYHWDIGSKINWSSFNFFRWKLWKPDVKFEKENRQNPLKVPLWLNNSRYPFFYVFVHNRSFLVILPNFNLLRILQRAFFGLLFPRI